MLKPGGIVTLHSPEFQSGLRANVIVIMTEKSLPSEQPNDVMQKKEASLRELLENVAAS